MKALFSLELTLKYANVIFITNSYLQRSGFL